MDKMKAHLTANLSLPGLLWAAVLIGVWVFLPGETILKVLLSLVSLVVAGYLGHRLLPRITGPMVENLYEDK